MLSRSILVIYKDSPNKKNLKSAFIPAMGEMENAISILMNESVHRNLIYV
jgi:hypothetical protein